MSRTKLCVHYITFATPTRKGLNLDRSVFGRWNLVLLMSSFSDFSPFEIRLLVSLLPHHDHLAFPNVGAHPFS